jgi:hypothetical protein
MHVAAANVSCGRLEEEEMRRGGKRALYVIDREGCSTLMTFSTTRQVGQDQQPCALVKCTSHRTHTPLSMLDCALRSTRSASVPNNASSSSLMRDA